MTTPTAKVEAIKRPEADDPNRDLLDSVALAACRGGVFS
jgi:hypothetical protein